jgi:DNA-binding transcriptional MerR regulator
MNGIDEATLSKIEREHASGLTSAEILDVFATHGVQLSEATLRKYVQLGLLPRSVRVGRKGKHQGSQGVYPVGVVRQILRIKQMMAEDYTIEQIQREFLFMRSDLQALGQTLDSLFDKLDRIVLERKKDATAKAVARDVNEARAISKDLLARLGAIETRLTSRTKIERVVAS